jgi:hypothetical protein
MRGRLEVSACLCRQTRVCVAADVGMFTRCNTVARGTTQRSRFGCFFGNQNPIKRRREPVDRLEPDVTFASHESGEDACVAPRLFAHGVVGQAARRDSLL